MAGSQEAVLTDDDRPVIGIIDIGIGWPVGHYKQGRSCGDFICHGKQNRDKGHFSAEHFGTAWQIKTHNLANRDRDKNKRQSAKNNPIQRRIRSRSAPSCSWVCWK